MNVALDSHISKRVHEALEAAGHVVVFRAGESALDEDWLLDAELSGADVVVSSDLDVPNWIDKNDSPMHWIEVKQSVRAKHQCTTIVRAVNRLASNMYRK